ncbi:MAG: type II CRISPR RNA-guided endonuclease Cas9 [Planctomycetes bacterium GWF2_41_51]|nr:CRISPR-associated protein Cas9 [uncultured bacterium]OHB50482.1 MAG: type II CRISPR RNA-guided endonuclease Cas9 [Planctomycetes bacterium GWF2_41_51]
MKLLGLDLGTNSVGSAWIDTDKKIIKMGVGVFPAGVEESEDKRGAPKNQDRRKNRQQRKSICRRSMLKRNLRQYLIKKKWIPTEKTELQEWYNLNPWILRKNAIEKELTEYEFGRVLLHFAQKRGAWWFDEEPEETGDTKKKKKDLSEVPGTVEYTKRKMKEKDAETFGKLIAIEYEARKTDTANNKKRNNRVKNRNNALGDKEMEFVADRHMILDEFLKIWAKQKSFNGELARQLNLPDAQKEIYNKQKTDIWRCQGVLFSQRKAYWNLGTLGRCELEPTDEKCPKADMYAQEFLVLTSVNNIRITPPGQETRKLDTPEREKVITAARKQKTVSESTVRTALGINKGENKALYTLNTDGDKFTVNGDWFYSQIVHDSFGENVWKSFNQNVKDSVNNAILKFEPNEEEDEQKLVAGCKKWWNLDDAQTGKFINVWKKRPKKDTRVNLSRKAIKNLLPYLRDGWSVTEARNMYAEDATNDANNLKRKRYSTKEIAVDKKIRHFLKKHPDMLPPVSDGISNPVVRKSIHEVRKHLMAHIKQFDKPDRVIIELSRKTRQSEKVIAKKMQINKAIDALTKEIIEKHNLNDGTITSTQKEAAIKRIRLCRQQRYVCAYSGVIEDKPYSCAYSGKSITEEQAKTGEGLEMDHIIPRSKGGNNGMSNLVLCYSTTNQGKKDRTPIDWLTEEEFGRLEQRFKHLKDEQDNYITKDNVDMSDKAKWTNLHRRTPKEGFTEEQLSSSAYAATQTTDWINKVLYGSQDRNKRYVFASNGDYTGILRRDWGLFFDEEGNRSEKGKKFRGDHRHHAVDAVVIALAPLFFQKIKESFIDFEKQKENKNIKPQWKTIAEPWEGFSQQVADEYKKLNVSHRAYNRKITGYLHKDSIYGPAIIYDRYQKDNEKKGIKKGELKRDENGNLVLKDGMYIKSIPVIKIEQGHLRMPNDWHSLKEEYKSAMANKKEIKKKMLALEEVPPAKSGIIRDIDLRDKICDWLKDNNFSEMKEAKKYIQENGLVINGTPIRKVRVLWKLNEVVEIPRKSFDYETGEFVKCEDRKSLRVYQTQNNHHIEIRESIKGQWNGDVITNFDAAKRARVDKKTIVDRNDTESGRFIMSLAKGEVVSMRHPATQNANYFVVFKIDSTGTIHFTKHTDANPASTKKKNVPIREDIDLTPQKLQKLGVAPGSVPYKVKISPLGEVRELIRD